MISLLRHKGYTGSFECSLEDNMIYGKVIGIKDLISYQGKSTIEFKNNFINAVDLYLESCNAYGREPQKTSREELSKFIYGKKEEILEELSKLSVV